MIVHHGTRQNQRNMTVAEVDALNRHNVYTYSDIEPVVDRFCANCGAWVLCLLFLPEDRFECNICGQDWPEVVEVCPGWSRIKQSSEESGQLSVAAIVPAEKGV